MLLVILGVFSCGVVGFAISEKQVAKAIPMFALPLVVAIPGYLVMKRFVFDLVDEVWDCGDSILVKNKGRDRHYALSEFMNVTYNGFTNPPRISLTLRQASNGSPSEVVFIPPFRMFPYTTHPVAGNLMVRIDEARRQVKSLSQT